jgi:hypothetical protein
MAKDKLDYPMLAADIAEVLSQNGYLEHIGDVGDDDIALVLVEFVAKLRKLAEDDAE